jgi:hypothetical protein
MTGARIYGDRHINSVSLPGFNSFYGFRTNIPTSAATVFGHQEDILATPPAGTVIMGANRPRPPRGKVLATGITSYVDRDFYTSTELAIIDRGLGVIVPYESAKSIKVEVDFYSAKYCWRMPKWQHAKISGDFGGLGISVVTGTNNNDAFQGIDYAYDGGAKVLPNRAVKVEQEAENVTSLSTFVTTPFTGTLPDGWVLKDANAWI